MSIKDITLINKYYDERKPYKLKDNMIYTIDGVSSIWNVLTSTTFNDIWGTLTTLETNFIDFICRTITFDYPPMINEPTNVTALWLEIFNKYGNRNVFDEYFRFISGWDNTSEERAFISRLIENDIRSCIYENRYKWVHEFESTILEFNPLWNVDAVIGTINEKKHTGTDATSHTGYDLLERDGSDTNTRSGNQELEYLGSKYNEKSGKETTTNTGHDITTESRTTFDSSTFVNTNKSDLQNGKVSTLSFDGANENQLYQDIERFTNRKDKTTYNDVEDERVLDIDEKQNYSSSLSKTLNLKDDELEMIIRQGNIGVTSTVTLLNEFRNFVNYRIMDIVAKDISKEITKGVY